MTGISRRAFLPLAAYGTAAAQPRRIRESMRVAAPHPRKGDDTDALQRAIDRLASGGVLDGGGRDYVVTRLNLKSNMTLQNFQLHAKGTATPLDSPVTIDGSAEAARHIVIRNVHVDGNRPAQTNLATEEDGGRDGFRIVGKAEDLLLIGCSAVNCATDGLKIFSYKSLSRDDSKLNFRSIYVVNCRFLKNRRHGASGDSLENVHFVDCEFSENGTDLPGAESEGSRGAVDDKLLYGAGVDIEGYGVGSGVNGLYFIRCKGYRNARFAIQFWEPTPASAPGFLPRRNIVLDNCSIDGGVNPRHGHQALELSQPVSIRSALPTYTNLSVVGLECSGTVILNCVHNVKFVGGRIRSPYPGFWGIGERSRGLFVVGLEAESKVFVMRG